jgi:hypothetical protein
VIRDLAPLRENYLTCTSPAGALLLPLPLLSPSSNFGSSINYRVQTLRQFRLNHISIFNPFSPQNKSIKMTGGGKSGGKASGSKNAQS